VGCGTSTAGTVAWVAEVKRACDAMLRQQHKMCPMLRCISQITTSECKQGTCVLKK
jgi:hypothetical protein